MDFRPSGVPPADLVQLYHKRAISEREYQQAIEWATKPPARDRWAGYLRDWFLIFGLLLVVAGVVVFGAYNWQALTRFEKLGILEMLVLACWGGSRLRGGDSLEGKVLLLAASLLVGALLAVFGQVYQTGADVYTLFLSWSALILPWCLAGRFNPIWLVEMVLLNTTFSLFWDQVAKGDFAEHAIATCALNLLLAAAWEGARRRHSWMSRGIRDLLLLVAVLPLSMASCAGFWEGDLYLACVPVTVVVCGVLVRWLGTQVRPMAIVAFAALTVIGGLTIRIFSELSILGFLMIAVALVVEITVAAKWLKAINAIAPPTERPMGEGKEGESRPSVLRTLADQGLLDSTPLPEERVVERGTPKYVSFLTAIGAWISSWFFLLFVVMWIADSGFGLFSTGILLWAGTIAATRRLAGRSEFLLHLCLAVNMAGQLMAIIGVGLGENWTTAGMTGTALVLQAIALFFYKDGLGRSIFAFAAVISGGLLFWETAGSTGLSCWLLAIAFFVSRLLIGQRGWLLSRWRYWHGAVAFGLSCGLLAMVTLWASTMGQNWSDWGEPQPWILGPGLTLLAVACAVRLQAPLSAVIALLFLGALTVSMPGLMAATLIFILAFHTRSLGVSWLAILGLLVFGVLYYYQLDLSFLAKSSSLICSGLVLLMARATLHSQVEAKHAF